MTIFNITFNANDSIRPSNIATELIPRVSFFHLNSIFQVPVDTIRQAGDALNMIAGLKAAYKVSWEANMSMTGFSKTHTSVQAYINICRLFIIASVKTRTSDLKVEI